MYIAISAQIDLISLKNIHKNTLGLKSDKLIHVSVKIKWNPTVSVIHTTWGTTTNWFMNTSGWSLQLQQSCVALLTLLCSLKCLRVEWVALTWPGFDWISSVEAVLLGCPLPHCQSETSRLGMNMSVIPCQWQKSNCKSAFHIPLAKAVTWHGGGGEWKSVDHTFVASHHIHFGEVTQRNILTR